MLMKILAGELRKDGSEVKEIVIFSQQLRQTESRLSGTRMR